MDRLGENKVENSSGDEGRCEVRREVMVYKELTVHQEEGEVMIGPGEQEEPSRVVQTVTNGCNKFNKSTTSSKTTVGTYGQE